MIAHLRSEGNLKLLDNIEDHQPKVAVEQIETEHIVKRRAFNKSIFAGNFEREHISTQSVLLKGLKNLRREFADKDIHIFGVGGISTLHLAASLEIDSVDSSGWRNRAARGIIQLPGKSERSVADLGSWKGRRMNEDETALLEACECPACKKYGTEGLTFPKSPGFYNRATHNLWVLLQENKWIEQKLSEGNYWNSYRGRIENSVYRGLIDSLAENHPQSTKPR